ncbi:hypothetical protein T190_05710 [Sinorhizobium meliloti CCBAU 01290]|nr:hypothetical protein T190_05710 [Sinorhizobium meliloti CCBAU 01290]
MAQLAANAAEIAALKAEKEALSARVVKLEEELELARLHRFAPKSEKHVDRLFDEAEQVADEDEASGEDGEVVDLPETGFATIEKPEGKSVAASPCRNTCRASVSSMTLPTTRRPALAAVIRCTAWVRPSPSSSISR